MKFLKCVIVVSEVPTEIPTQYNQYANLFDKLFQINGELTVNINVDASRSV